MLKTINILNKRIDKGIKWLDNQVGRKEWVNRINLEKLNLNNTNVCVLGQVFESFWRKIYTEPTEKGSNNLTYKEAVSRGFALKQGIGSNRDYDLLTYLWYLKIKKMLKTK